MVSGTIQEAIEIALLTGFYLPWLWDVADGIGWKLAKNISWFHQSEIWGTHTIIENLYADDFQRVMRIIICQALRGQPACLVSALRVSHSAMCSHPMWEGYAGQAAYTHKEQ